MEFTSIKQKTSRMYNYDDADIEKVSKQIRNNEYRLFITTDEPDDMLTGIRPDSIIGDVISLYKENDEWLIDIRTNKRSSGYDVLESIASDTGTIQTWRFTFRGFGNVDGSSVHNANIISVKLWVNAE